MRKHFAQLRNELSISQAFSSTPHHKPSPPPRWVKESRFEDEGHMLPTRQIVLRRGLEIPLTSLSSTQLSIIQEELTFTPNVKFRLPVASASASVASNLHCYTLGDGIIRVPRCYRPPTNLSVADELSEGLPLRADLVFSQELRPHQQVAASRSLEELRRAPNHACILTLPCGYGKTVVAIHVAIALGRRTLVCVHTEILVNQWTERIRAFAPSARVGSIRGPKVDVQDTDFVVAMIQSLAMRTYDEELLATFGLVVIDEAHHLAARVFSDIFFRVPARHVLGLTATPKRKDGCTPILHLHMGGFSYLVERRDNDEEASVAFLKYSSPLARPGHDPGPAGTQRLKTSLSRDAARNALLVDVCRAAIADGRALVCLTDRVQHAEDLRALFVEQCGGVPSAIYTGRKTAAERRAAEENCRALFATFSLAKEGLDIPRLDTLVLALPVGDVVQAVGRILRPHPGKRSPLVVDVTDDLALPFVRLAGARRSWYHHAKYEIVDVTSAAEVETHMASVEIRERQRSNAPVTEILADPCRKRKIET
jgi:superfamily II DNA or RNA helicase